jgi:hypothetical protein
MPSHHLASQRRRFPGVRWVAVALAFPIAGLIGWAIGGRVDSVVPALVGGALTGAGLGAVQWWAAKGALGRAAAWIGSSAVGYAAGLATGAALVGYETDLGALATMGAVSGLVLGAAQGLALAAQGRTRLAVAWAAAMPVLFTLGWSVTTAGGISVENQFTVFGAYGAAVFTLLSGLLLARFTRVRVVEETPKRGPRREEGDDEQRHRYEASEAHRIAEDEVDQFQHDELAAGRDHPQRRRRRELGAPRVGVPEPAQEPALEVDHDLQGDLEERCSQQREREAFADDRWDVLDREVQDDHVDEDVDDVRRAGADPSGNVTS